jgi:hypothetical protein
MRGDAIEGDLMKHPIHCTTHAVPTPTCQTCVVCLILQNVLVVQEDANRLLAAEAKVIRVLSQREHERDYAVLNQLLETCAELSKDMLRHSEDGSAQMEKFRNEIAGSRPS